MKPGQLMAWPEWSAHAVCRDISAGLVGCSTSLALPPVMGIPFRTRRVRTTLKSRIKDNFQPKEAA